MGAFSDLQAVSVGTSDGPPNYGNATDAYETQMWSRLFLLQ